MGRGSDDCRVDLSSRVLKGSLVTVEPGLLKGWMVKATAGVLPGSLVT